MMDRKARTGLNSQIYDEACEWFVEFRGGQINTARRQGLANWLRKSPEHLRAYLEIAAIWHDGPSLDPAGKWDDATLLADLSDEPDNIIAHPSHSTVHPSPPAHASATKVRTVTPWRPLAAAASILVALLGAWLYIQRNVYATDIGEQRSIRLADGSTVDLNSRSKIEVRYSNGQRAIELVEGQALFQVAKEPDRPFIVTSGNTRVHAVGTQFDVNRKRSGTVVTVLEGRVAVESAQAPVASLPVSDTGQSSAPGATSEIHSGIDIEKIPKKKIYLGAGEQLYMASATAPQVAPANLATVAAWKQHQLVFEGATLTDVAEEFNRYNERQLSIQDPELYDFHISGVFSTVDPQGLLDFLRTRPGIEIAETASGYRIAKKLAH